MQYSTAFLLNPTKKLSWVFLFLVTFSWGQQIRVIDALTQAPLQEVVITNPDRSSFAITNEKGVFDGAVFRSSEKLQIQQMGYETQSLTLEEIKKRSFVIALNLDEKQLSEIVLSVARTAEQSEKIAEKVTVISPDKTKAAFPLNGAEILNAAPSIRVQKSQGGGGSPVLRGFEANRVLLVVDGVRLNNAIYRSGHLQNAMTIDPNSIERIEVIYGSSAVGYGSDALGGVVHYYTKTPKINNTQKLNNRISTQYNSALNANTYHFENEMSFAKWATFTSFSYASFGDIRMGKNRTHGYTDWGLVPFYSNNTSNDYFAAPTLNENPHVQKNTGYTQFDFLQKSIFNLGADSQLLLNLQYSRSSDVPRFDKLNEYRDNALRFAEWNYGPQKRLLVSPQLKLFPKKKGLYKGTITAAFQTIEESRIQRKFTSLNRETQKENVQVWSLNGDFEVKKTPSNSLSYGFEVIHNEIKSEAFAQELRVIENQVSSLTAALPIPTRYPSDGSSYASQALYSNFRYDLNPKTSLSLGGRFTATTLKARWKDNGFLLSDFDEVNVKNNALTGSFSVSYRPEEPWQVHLLFSSGFRAPNIDDLGKIRENKGMLLVPNPELKPEYVYSIDGGVRFIPYSKKINLNLRFYTTGIKDYIGRMIHNLASEVSASDVNAIMFSEEMVLTQANTNIGNARISGLSLEGKWKMTQALALAHYTTYTHASENNVLGPLPSILPFFGRNEITFDDQNFSFQFRHEFAGKKKAEDFSLGGEDGLEETPVINLPNGLTRFAGSPRWSTFSLYGQYEVNEQVEVNIGIENITDVHYRTFASGVSAPGRSFLVGAHANF